MSPSVIAPAISLFQNMPKFNLSDILSGNIDITAFEPVIEAVTQIAESSSFTPTAAAAESTAPPPVGLEPISDFAAQNITYSLDGYFKSE